MSLSDQLIALNTLLIDLEGRVESIRSLPNQFAAVTSEVMSLVTSVSAQHYLAQWFHIYLAFIDEVMVLYVGELWREYHVQENVSNVYKSKEGYYKRKTSRVSVDGFNFFYEELAEALKTQKSVKRSERDRIGDELDELALRLDQNAKMRIEQIQRDLRSQVVEFLKKLDQMNLLGSRGEGLNYERHLSETWNLYKLSRDDSMRKTNKACALSTSIVSYEEDESLKSNKQKKNSQYTVVDVEEIAAEAKKKEEMKREKESQKKAEEERQRTDFSNAYSSITAIKKAAVRLDGDTESEDETGKQEEEAEEWEGMQDDDGDVVAASSSTVSVLTVQKSTTRRAGGDHQAPSDNIKAKRQRCSKDVSFVAKSAVHTDGMPQPVIQKFTVLLSSIEDVTIDLCASFCSLTEAGKKLVSTSSVLEEVFRRLWTKIPIQWPKVPKFLCIGKELYSHGSHFSLSSTSTAIQILCFESALLSKLLHILKEEVDRVGRTPNVEFVFRVCASLEPLTASSRSNDVYLDLSYLGNALVEDSKFVCQVLNFFTTRLASCALHINVSGCNLDGQLLMKLISSASTLQVAHCGAITLDDSCTLALGPQLTSFSLCNTPLTLKHAQSVKNFMCSLLSNCKKLSKLNLSYCVGNNSAHMEMECLTLLLLEAIQARQAASTETSDSFAPLTIQLHGTHEAFPAIIEGFLKNAYEASQSLVVEVQGSSLFLFQD